MKKDYKDVFPRFKNLIQQQKNAYLSIKIKTFAKAFLKAINKKVRIMANQVERIKTYSLQIMHE